MADFFGDLDPPENDALVFSGGDTARLNRMSLSFLYILILIVLFYFWPYLSLVWILFAFLHLVYRSAWTSGSGVVVRDFYIRHLKLIYAAIVDILDILGDLVICYLERLIDQQLRNGRMLGRMLDEADVVDVELHEYDLQAWRERMRGRMGMQRGHEHQD